MPFDGIVKARKRAMDRTSIVAFIASFLMHIALIPLVFSLVARPTPYPFSHAIIAVDLIDASTGVERRKEKVSIQKTMTVVAPKIGEERELARDERTAFTAPQVEAYVQKPPGKLEESGASLRAFAPESGGQKSPKPSGEAGEGEVVFIPGTGIAAGKGQGPAGLGQGKSDDGSGGGGMGEGFGPGAGFSGPASGYQVKPRYPDSARRAGAYGTTLLKVRVLENGGVGQILVEQSAGHPDLDDSAREAVAQWQFVPARRGNEPVAVWVRLPVKFELW